MAGSSAEPPSASFGPDRFGLGLLGLGRCRRSIRRDADRRTRRNRRQHRAVRRQRRAEHRRAVHQRQATTTSAGRATATWRSPQPTPAARRHVRAAPEPQLHQATVGCRSAGDRPWRRLSEPGSVALHVDGHLDAGQVRRRAGNRLDRPLARWTTGRDSGSHGRDHRLVGSAAPARCCPPRRCRAAERLGHVRHRNRAVGHPHVQRAARYGRQLGRGGRGTTCIASVCDDANSISPKTSPRSTRRSRQATTSCRR